MDKEEMSKRLKEYLNSISDEELLEELKDYGVILTNINENECCDKNAYRGADGKWYLKVRTSCVRISYCPFCGRKLL